MENSCKQFSPLEHPSSVQRSPVTETQALRHGHSPQQQPARALLQRGSGEAADHVDPPTPGLCFETKALEAVCKAGGRGRSCGPWREY